MSVPEIQGPPADFEAFLKDLKLFHEERGTVLDVNPRVNGKSIDLYRLFYIVANRGGYDAVSAEKLAWRKVGQEFNLGQTNAAAYAYTLKKVFYKNLAAYAIKRIYQQDPPPPEILEHVSARGGDLRHRTMENFKPPQVRENTNGNESDVSGAEEHRTPKEDKTELEDPSSGGGRSSRGLRQAPPQRVLFQPDVSSTRRQPSGNAHSPQPYPTTTSGGNAYSPFAHLNSTSNTIANYEPKSHVPLTLRPVITPGNNAIAFRERTKRVRDAHREKLEKANPGYKGMMLPGTGFDGPNIYVRTLLALRSGIPQEQDYALHHLVKISNERGDKYKFEAFSGLAEGLIEKALEVSSLFYDIKWEVSYLNDDSSARLLHVLDGMNGTPDLLDRISQLRMLNNRDEVESDEFGRKLLKINEAGLVIRNMSLLEENAKYLSVQHPLRDFLTIALNLPNLTVLIELKHYALEIAEQLTKYWSIGPSDSLYVTLLNFMDQGLDRGAALTSLRAISRICLNLEDSNRLNGVRLSAITRLSEWILLDDEELVAASLDFFYQYTAVPENVLFMLDQTSHGNFPLQPLILQLSRLLLHHAQKTASKRIRSPAVPPQPATETPTVPPDLLDQILQFAEPERSANWLRTSFYEDRESEITQIALWQAYQAQFTPHANAQTPNLLAADFIKNVSVTFPNAAAQVISGPSPRFIIKGICHRHMATDMQGRQYSRCLWKPTESPTGCGQLFAGPTAMWEHLVSSHIGLSRTETSWNFAELRMAAALRGEKFDCYWAECRHFRHHHALGGTDNPYDVGMHVKTHLPWAEAEAVYPGRPSKTNDPVLDGQPAVSDSFTFYNTAMDERGEAAGLPLTSVLVLRNLARNIPKAAVGLEPVAGQPSRADGDHGWMRLLFDPVQEQLWYVLTHNRPLAVHAWDLIVACERGVDG